MILSLFATGCGVVTEDGSKHIKSLNSRISPTFTGVAEKSFCNTPIVHSSPSTITGTATYTEREPNGSGLGSESPLRNIRHAEIEVYNSTGQIIQCSSVDASGNFSFDVPTGPETLVLRINSRADNNFVKASILNMPEQNLLYFIQTSFVGNASKNIGNLNASATASNYVGAAFHILDLITSTNDYLRTEVGNCSVAIDGCVDFTVADKVSVYWEPGFNPNSYYGDPESGVSFYIRGFFRLFILGGINGDVDSSDTDHFDDTIVVHEYGHFLQDVYSTDDTPGGAHDGTVPIDPRLALSEAWANVLQAAVNYGPADPNPLYLDTAGNVDGTVTANLLNIPLEDQVDGCTIATIGCDNPTEIGEGNYREFAITRALWDVIDTVDDSETVSGDFNQIWASITSGNGFISDTNSRFRSAGLLYDIQGSLSQGATTPITDWTAALTQTENLQLNNRGSYAQRLTATGGCPVRNFNINPLNEIFDNREFDTSNLYFNNDFYHYKQTVSGPANFALNYLSGPGVEADLDLFIYNEAAEYGEFIDMVGQARGFTNTPATDVETETINISNLPAGDYLINVKVKTHLSASVGASTDYELTLGGTRLCP